MSPVREVYTYTLNDLYQYNQLSPSSNNLGSNTDNIDGVENANYILYNNKKLPTGKIVLNEFVTKFQDKTSVYSSNALLSFEDKSDSYIIFLLSYKTSDRFLKKNKTFVSKAVGTGGKYLGKEITVTVKTDETTTRKVILEY